MHILDQTKLLGVNRSLPSLQEGLLEITLTVPLTVLIFLFGIRSYVKVQICTKQKKVKKQKNFFLKYGKHLMVSLNVSKP